ncbi:hypothetical protein Pla175_26750 [Pirellulimonas nuda]|uniref:DUF4159 domain-containing protein n=1 Tax=Pirellulimonas nuda TaxID=2528009 RepID=A0A518DCY1_9BACT|nr:DUF4159 domain-containing protein [Pirellulimonas nuda]QDU89286.1 hypothetical protein Pla175_26750 [Pirellulimonas nuda]
MKQNVRCLLPIRPAAAAALFLTIAGVVAAQRGFESWYDDSDNRGGVPDWKNQAGFEKDVFTFVRVQWSSDGGTGRFGDNGRGWGRGRGGGWRTDWPSSDNNFSYRLQQLTSLKVNPQPAIVRLTDDELFDYPFIYIIEPGSLTFSEAEVEALRRYLLSGGFLMVDDFWGDYEWANFESQIKRVFPNRPLVELPLDHEVFSCVYRLKEKPQVCSYDRAWENRDSNGRVLPGRENVTWEDERRHGGDCRTVHYKGIVDDKGRLMAIICHNTDLGDGWEREGMAEWYFSEFAENKSYPMGINIVVYAMTH